MINVTKEQGKYLNRVAPEYVVKTVHGRHYYMVDCIAAKRILRKMEQHPVIYSYGEKK